MMANFGNSYLLGNQKRRNFIYNPSVSRPGVRNLAQESGAQLRSRVPNIKHESPYKRFKNSNGLPTKRLEEIAKEDACRDLPSDAFDEEIVDDFDDELLTAEQLDQCDRMVSRELETQRTDHNVDFIANLPQKDEHRNASRNFVPSSSHLDRGQGSCDEDELLASHCTQDYATYSTPTKAHTNFTDLPGFPVNGSRIPRAPVITNPEETANLRVKTVVKGDSLLETFVEHPCGPSNFLPKSDTDFVTTEGEASVASNSDNNFLDHSKDEQMNSLRKEIEKLKTEFMSSNAKVKRLEDEKFCKDGEIRILKDSLSHFENEEKKRQAEVKAIAEKQAREQSQHEKELQKQVENLTTQIQFKDREISQLVERNKKRSSSSTELCSTPQKKPVNLSEVFPTGSSFFQKKSPEAKVKSPRGTKLNVKNMETPGKNNSQRLSEGDISESSVQSATSSGASTIERTRAQRREAEVRERQAVQLFSQNFQDVELVQNLISPQEKELNIPFQEPYNRTLNYGSIISLLTLDRSSLSSCSVTQRTTLNDTDTSHTLRLFDTQATSKLQRSIAVLTPKDSLSDNQDNSLVLQTLSVLLNHCHTQRGSENMSLPSSSKHCMLSPATNFLPLIESHISNYVEQRTDSGDENFLGTCLPRSSPTPDSPDPRDSPSFESDHTRNLAFLQEIALISLRLLNIIVLYSREVREFILKSARVFSEIESDHENDKRADREDERQKIFSSEEGEGSFCQHPLFSSLKIAIKKDPNRQMEVTTEKDINTSRRENVVERTELLGYLFKLLVPQPKESMVVTYATLQVLISLSRNCEVKYCTRMLPLLSESLLTQCLSRDWCLTSLSLVTSVLTPLIRHQGIVKRLCSQSGECILLKIYQGWLFRPDDVSVHDYQQVHLQIVSFVNNLLSSNDASILFFHPESECHCNIELIKCLVLMLDKVVSSVVQVSYDSLLKDSQNRQSLVLLRQSVFLLATLCLNDRLFVEHRIEVEHQYVNVISSVTRLYQRITGLISEVEVLAVQDLVDFEHIDGIDWSQESEDEIDETTEGMDVDE